MILEAADTSSFFLNWNKTDLGLNITFNIFVVEIPREPDQQRDCWWPPCVARSAAALAIYDRQGHCISRGLTSTTYAISVSVCKFEKNRIYFSVFKNVFSKTEVTLLSAVWPCFVIVQWSAVITRFNIVRYYINNYRNWGRISIRCWTLKRHAIPRPHERVIGVFCEYLWENLPHYNGTALYVVITRSDISTRHADITETLWVWAVPLLTTTNSNHVHRVAANAVTTNAFSLTEHGRL